MKRPHLAPSSVECRRNGRRDPEAVKREGWREDGILVVELNDDRLTWPERELIRQLGNRLYGQGRYSLPAIQGA